MAITPEEHADPSDHTNSQLEKRLFLVQNLKTLANWYSKDYADGIDDGCRASVGSDDLGRTIESDFWFEAKRERTEPAFIGADIPENIEFFHISSWIKRNQLRRATVPQALFDLLIEIGDYEPEDLADPGKEFGIGLYNQYSIDTVGNFEPDLELLFFANDDRIEIPPDVIHQILSDESAPPADDELFGSIFSRDELDSIQTIANNVEHQTDARVALRQFAEQMPSVQNAPLMQRYDMALNIARHIFGVTVDGSDDASMES